MHPQDASPSPTPRPSTPPNAYTLTLNLSPWSFARLFHSSPPSPQRTRPHPQSATPPETADPWYTTSRAPSRRSQHHHDSPATDEEEEGEAEWSDHAHSDGELSLLYASPRNEPSLLYTVRSSPARYTAWDDSDLLQLDTPPRPLSGVVEEDTPRSARRSSYLVVEEEYRLELPGLWEWRWAVAAAAGFFVGWGAAACGRYGVSVVAVVVFVVGVRWA